MMGKITWWLSHPTKKSETYGKGVQDHYLRRSGTFKTMFQSSFWFFFCSKYLNLPPFFCWISYSYPILCVYYLWHTVQTEKKYPAPYQITWPSTNWELMDWASGDRFSLEWLNKNSTVLSHSWALWCRIDDWLVVKKLSWKIWVNGFRMTSHIWNGK